MPKYKVMYREIVRFECEVEAEDEDQATDFVDEMHRSVRNVREVYNWTEYDDVSQI